MELIDLLSDSDKDLIKSFIESYADVKNVDLNKSLYHWNKNKKRLYRALGKKFRVKIPICIEQNTTTLMTQLREVYRPSLEEDGNHPFIKELAKYLMDTMMLSQRWINEIQFFLNPTNIKAGYFNRDYSIPVDSSGNTITISRGSKFMKSVQKYLKAINFPRMDLFEKWRNDISNITTSKRINTNLVFSIHPIDFLTMSDNSCGWTSCMSWMNDGGYSGGVTEMMTSNMVIICYLESKNKKFYFNMREVPNKSWRALVYVHKDIILVGKQYPYTNNEIAKVALNNLQDILKDTLEWKYKYKNQLYKDMLPFHDNAYVRTSPLSRISRTGKHKILIYTNGMYNDLIQDSHNNYWCCRNNVKKTIKLNASGLATCMACGKPLEKQSMMNEDSVDEYVLSHGPDKICFECIKKLSCGYCGKVCNDTKLYNIIEIVVIPRQELTTIRRTVCEDCFSYYYSWKDKGVFIHIDNLIPIKRVCNDIKNDDLIPVRGKEKSFERYKVSCAV